MTASSRSEHRGCQMQLNDVKNPSVALQILQHLLPDGSGSEEEGVLRLVCLQTSWTKVPVSAARSYTSAEQNAINNVPGIC